ncbi:MAG: cation transporter [Marinobacter sp.]|nr:cation transporter [Marinobacter sp.]
MPRALTEEDKLIAISALMSLFFAVGGIAIGWWLKSSIIIFDGIYSLISLGLSLLSLVAGRYVRLRDDAKFPFGKSIIQPITLVFKYLTIFLLCTLSIIDGIQTLLAGGRELNYLSALIYSGIVTLLCLGAYRFLVARTKPEHSELLVAEHREWLLDTGLSLMLTVGFALALTLAWFGFRDMALYIDPIMLIIAATYFLRIPVTGLLSSGREVVGLKVADELEDEIRSYVDDIVRARGFRSHFLRIQKVGTTVYLEVDFVVKDPGNALTIVEQDRIRAELFAKIRHHPYRWWYTVSFTADEQWAR